MNLNSRSFVTQYYYITTMGCQMNEYDSNYTAQCLQEMGLQPIDPPEKADLILINTCSVRAKAQQKALSVLGRMIKIKKKRPSIILGIMGCVAQQEGWNLIKRFPDLDLVLGTREIDKLQSLLHQLVRGKTKVVSTDLDKELFTTIYNNQFFEGKITSFISIMQGCNNYCSYCIVPYVRGREICRPPGEIVKEAENLIKQGVKEITLLGQNVNSYVWRDNGEIKFSDLLRLLNNVPNLVRIRFTTSHPKDLSNDLIRCFNEFDRLCPHIHLPFQAGSNKILKMMNRGYTREQYIDIIQRLRSARPDIAITSDVMVGFPGESDEDFKKTLDLIQKIEFDNLFSFIYSDRKGTVAEKMPGKISESDKITRLSILQNLQKEITLKKNRMLVGIDTQVLVEGYSKKGKQFTGRTRTNKIVNFLHENDIIGRLVQVKIDVAYINSLYGKVINSI
ncbi:MAG: tRNA (N6-isopentenyl adenosine(37)-C2)-methylthiotransferase MiaB [Deltaproteobacteria bacterium]|nr:tRNA (N6-isopentenyl adenosine(37)-C2)-methylthiotransferase MiaB [Deltaproteobacteria bacterium]